jgi:hypothetical protein
MLAFPLAKAQAHLKQHHSTIKESYNVLAFPLAKAQAHLEQHHSTLGKASAC